MDNEPEDWEKLERIKVERKKAQLDSTIKDESNLQYLDPSAFAVQKGFTNNPEAYRTGSEKISGICLVTIILGAILDLILTFITINLHMGLADMIPQKIEEFVRFTMVMIPAFASIFAAIEAIIYSIKTHKKFFGPLINVAATIMIFLAYFKIRELILGV